MRRRAEQEPALPPIPPDLILVPQYNVEVWAPPAALKRYREGTEDYSSVQIAAWHAHSQAMAAWAARDGLRWPEATRILDRARAKSLA